MNKILTTEEREKSLKPLLAAGWTLKTDKDAIYKEYKFADFNEVFGFACRLCLHVEKMNYYPELYNVYSKMKVTLFSPDVNGLTQRDVNVAIFLDKVARGIELSR